MKRKTMTLSANNLGFAYRDCWAVRGVTFDLPDGEILGFIGPNGSGKTTLLRLMAGILQPQEGTVKLERRDLQSYSRRQVARRIAYVPQQSSWAFPFTVQEVVLMGRSPHLGMIRWEGSRDWELVKKSLGATDTLGLALRPVNELSGGELQRVIIARALAQEPRILLLDEPTAHLDLDHQAAVLEILRDLNRRHKLTIILVSHDINLAANFCHRLLLINQGGVVHWGPAEEVVNLEILNRVYRCGLEVERNIKTQKPQVRVKGLDY